MTLNLSIAPLLALVAGIIILVVPKMLNYVVAIYLIVIGVLGILGYSGYTYR
jgi:threonine/homoserine efflux transporter RhtA